MLLIFKQTRRTRKSCTLRWPLTEVCWTLRRDRHFAAINEFLFQVYVVLCTPVSLVKSVTNWMLRQTQNIRKSSALATKAVLFYKDCSLRSSSLLRMRLVFRLSNRNRWKFTFHCLLDWTCSTNFLGRIENRYRSFEFWLRLWSWKNHLQQIPYRCILQSISHPNFQRQIGRGEC